MYYLFFQVHEYLRQKMCSLYENDCIFDKFECCWSGDDSAIMTGSYNNFFRMFDRVNKRDATLEASREIAKPKTVLKPRKVSHHLRFACPQNPASYIFRVHTIFTKYLLKYLIIVLKLNKLSNPTKMSRVFFVSTQST